jgi:hypothetical protein
MHVNNDAVCGATNEHSTLAGVLSVSEPGIPASSEGDKESRAGAARRVRRKLAERRRSLTSRAQASRAASLRKRKVGRVGFEPT